MAYVFLVVSAICLSVMAVLRKKYCDESGSGVIPILRFMVLQGIIAAAILTVYAFVSGQGAAFKETDLFTMICVFATAACTSVTLVICICGVKYGNLTLLMMFATLGSLVLSSVYGVLFDGERNGIGVFKIIGFVLTAAILTLSVPFKRKSNDESDEAKTERDARQSAKNKKIYALLCVVIFFTNGVVLVFYSAMTKYRPEYPAPNFIVLYMAILAAISLIPYIVFAVVKKGNAIPRNDTKLGKQLLLIAAYSIVAVLSEVSSYNCTSLIPIIVQAPLSFTIEILLTGVADYVMFKAVPDKIQIVQMVLAVICSVCFVL